MGAASHNGCVIGDLARIASLRRFELHAIVAAEDHIHVLLSCEANRDIPRLAQLIKGSLSRSLTVAAGDEPARSTHGEVLPHHKWWTRQYSFTALHEHEPVERLLEQLMAHDTDHATLWKEGTEGLRD